MSLLPETHEIQGKLAMYCRDGNSIALPGTKQKGLEQYRRLVFNIINDNLESAFPIAFEYLPEEHWQKLVYDFFSMHKCTTYQVWKIPFEFFRFVEKKDYQAQLNIPYLNDLLFFEWTEMELYNMEDEDQKPYKTEGDYLNEQIVFNSEFRLLKLDYPLHLMKPGEALNKKGNYFVLLFREAGSGKIQFVNLSVWLAFIIEQMHFNQSTLKGLLLQAPSLFGESINLNDLESNSIKFLKEMHSKHFLLGFQKGF